MRLLASVIVLAASIGAYGQQEQIVLNQPLVVIRDGKFGYIDHSGNVVIPPRFYWGGIFSNGFAKVYVCGREVSINVTGRIQPLRVESDGGLAISHAGSKIGYVDSAGQFRIPARFEDGLPFSEGLAAVKSGGKWGFIDTGAHFQIPPQFDSAYYFHEGVAIAETGNRWVLINQAGRTVSDGFDVLADISEGRVLVSRGGGWGFIDFSGKIVVPLIYDSAQRGFESGLTSLGKDGKWGYLDRDGNVVIPFRFDEAGSFFRNGLAPAKIANQTGFIDRAGQFRFMLEYEYSPGFVYGDVAPFWTKDGHLGYVNETGRVIWGPGADACEHAPLLGWTKEDATKSCDGVAESLRRLVGSFPRN